MSAWFNYTAVFQIVVAGLLGDLPITFRQMCIELAHMLELARDPTPQGGGQDFICQCAARAGQHRAELFERMRKTPACLLITHDATGGMHVRPMTTQAVEEAGIVVPSVNTCAWPSLSSAAASVYEFTKLTLALW